MVDRDALKRWFCGEILPLEPPLTRFIRRNWRNEAESSFMLLAKSCHDLDWIRYIMARPCAAVGPCGRSRWE